MDTHQGMPIREVEEINTSVWHVSFGPTVNMNPTRWQQVKISLARRVGLLRDAAAVIRGDKIAVDADEYWSDL